MLKALCKIIAWIFQWLTCGSNRWIEEFFFLFLALFVTGYCYLVGLQFWFARLGNLKVAVHVAVRLLQESIEKWNI